MIIGFGNRRKVANAINFVFVTAVVASAGINEVQQTPSHKVEYKHVTPAVVAPSGPSVKKVYLKSGEFLDYRYVTPTEDAVEPPTPSPEIPSSGGGRGGQDPGYTRQREDALKETRKRRILQEDEEMVALIMAMVTEGLI